MTLSIYNTANLKKEAFSPLDDKGKYIGMYVCGPTVYDYIHIGNARPLVVFDVLYRLLKRQYEKVTYVRNITDVDDKINARALQESISIQDLTQKTIQQFHDDVKMLGCLPPDVEPRATDHIGEMIALIEKLLSKNHAYIAENHVLFDTESMADYGKFARKNHQDLIAGARVDVAPYKKNASDFVLWKPSDEGQPAWESPWGLGRPGWHIECSAMSEKYLSANFDIHGGGQDLIFPHHQNEIAQSCSAHDGCIYAKYWMHNGYLLSEGEKMSKSLNNFYTVRELLDDTPGEALRLVLLQTHYRQPLDFSRDKLKQAKNILNKFYDILGMNGGVETVDIQKNTATPDIIAALNDDLNTPKALAHLHEYLHIFKANPSHENKEILLTAGAMMGLLQQSPDDWQKSQRHIDGIAPTEIEDLIKKRSLLKQQKDYEGADAIREQLKTYNIVLKDSPNGTTWHKG